MATKKPARKPVSKAGQKRVSAKISHLAHTEPHLTPKQRVGKAHGMERAHRLGPKGAYKPVHKMAVRRTPKKVKR